VLDLSLYHVLVTVSSVVLCVTVRDYYSRVLPAHPTAKVNVTVAPSPAAATVKSAQVALIP
jgi:hypothetical protein